MVLQAGMQSFWKLASINFSISLFVSSIAVLQCDSYFNEYFTTIVISYR